MKLSQLAFLADENIHPDVVEYLRKSGLDVATAQDEGLSGLNDIELMRGAFRANRVVLTHIGAGYRAADSRVLVMTFPSSGAQCAASPGAARL